MYQPSEFEQRLSALQSQVERLNVSVQAREPQDGQPPEHQVSKLTERWTEILDRFASTGQRHSRAVGELEQRVAEWHSIEERIQHDASAQLSDLHRVIEQEWTALRQIHADPVNELKEQAASLRDVCVATATAAASGFDRAEARLTALETDLRDQLARLTEQVQLAVVELRSQTVATQSALASGASWPLDGVMRLHSQFREGNQPGGTSLQRSERRDVQALEGIASAPAASPSATETETKADSARPTSAATRALQIAMGVVIVVALGFAVASQRDAGRSALHAAEVEQRARVAMDSAEQQMAASRQEAAREIAVARDSVLKAQTTADVLAAPDLVRFRLVGLDELVRPTGQLLWSRSAGMVFSGSRLPAAPPDTTYQLWLLTNTNPVSGGLFVPDKDGRATLATDTPPRVPQAVIGVAVTSEPTGGRDLPSGPRLLVGAEKGLARP